MIDLSGMGYGFVQCEPPEKGKGIRMIYEATALDLGEGYTLTPAELFAAATGRAYVDEIDLIIGIKKCGKPGDTPESISAEAKAKDLDHATSPSPTKIPASHGRQEMMTDNLGSVVADG